MQLYSPRGSKRHKNNIARFIRQSLNIGKHASTGVGENRLGIVAGSQFPEMADIVGESIQDLDPTSNTFGQFVFMAGYE